MVHTGTFPNGILNEQGTLCREYILQERTFRTMLDVGNDTTLDVKQINDASYYDAAIISKRLKVAGIDSLTPDMVLDLEGADADELARAMIDLDKRRGEFRKSHQAPEKKADSTPEAGSTVV